MKIKRIISIFMTCLIAISVLILPIGVEAADEITISSYLSWESGKIDATTGNEVAVPTQIRTGYVSMTDYKTITMSLSTTTGRVFNVFWYDANKKYIKSESATSNTSTFTVSGDYARFTIYKSDIALSEGSNLTVKATPFKTSPLLSYSEKKIGASWTVGNIIINEGSSPTPYTSATKWIYSTTFDVSNFSHIKFTNSKGGSLFLNFVYLDEDNIIKGSYTPNNSVKLSGGTTIELPAGTKRVIAEIYNKDNNAAASDADSVVMTGILNLSQSVIDANKKGSLNIYKYEMEDVSKAGPAGKGVNSDASNVPSVAVPLANVTFKITKVADIGSKYYTSAGVKLPTVDEAKAMSAISTQTKNTDGSGYASFTDLPLGIYLVQEQSSPAWVTQKTQDFVVSIPTTNESGDGWNYDVFVYPKNQTKYADISIKKVDFLTGEPLSGAEFQIDISVNSVFQEWETGLKTDESGIAVPTKPLPIKTYFRVIETKAPDKYILNYNSQNSMSSSKVGDRAWIYINENGEVCDSNSKEVLDANNPYTLLFANSKPSIKKYVDKSKGNNTDLVKETTIGHSSLEDRNYYTIEVTTPNIDMKNLSTFTVTDTLSWSKQEARVESVKEKGGSALTEGSTTYSVTKNYVEASSYTDLTIEFSTESNTTIKKNTTYYISISTLQIPVTSNCTNTAKLTYTTHTNTKTTADIYSNSTKIRSGAFQFKKINPEGTGLANAEFKLYKSLRDAEAGINAVSAYDETTAKYTDTFKSNSAGTVTIRYIEYGDDLDGSDTYYISETKAPSGYNMLSAPLEITVSPTSHSYSNTKYDVKNSPLLIFPPTGGYGFYISIFAGVLFIAIASVTLVRFVKYKKKNVKPEK